jgi:hypothetical protein
LADETVGLREQEGGGYLVNFYERQLGAIRRDGRFLRFAPPCARLRYAREAP